MRDATYIMPPSPGMSVSVVFKIFVLYYQRIIFPFFLEISTIVDVSYGCHVTAPFTSPAFCFLHMLVIWHGIVQTNYRTTRDLGSMRDMAFYLMNRLQLSWKSSFKILGAAFSVSFSVLCSLLPK